MIGVDRHFLSLEVAGCHFWRGSACHLVASLHITVNGRLKKGGGPAPTSSMVSASVKPRQEALKVW
jgi:hypothetical protein